MRRQTSEQQPAPNTMATRALGLPGFVVLSAAEYGGELEQLIETVQVEAFCRSCGVRAVAHGRRPTWVRDLACGGRPTVLTWHKRIWRCPEPRCQAGTWTETSELRRLLAVAGRGGVRTDIAQHLHRFYRWAADSHLPEAERLAQTVTAWWPQIEAFLRLNITNAGTESVNRQIKTQGRLARGFRNLPNQRRRVRFACLPQSRRATVTGQMPPQV